MKRMLLWAGLGTFAGFALFAFLFFVAIERRGPDSGVMLVFALMAALPVGIMGAIFVAIGIIKDELNDVRREIMRLQSIEEMVTRQEKRSTEFRSTPGRGLE
jgi:hypothetical protein